MKSKLTGIGSTSNFIVLTEKGRQLKFYQDNEFDGEVTSKKDVFKSSGFLAMFSSPEIEEEVKAIVPDYVAPIFAIRHSCVLKELTRAKNNDVEIVLLIAAGKNPIYMEKLGGRSGQDPKYKNIVYYVIDIPEVLEEVKEIYKANNITINPDRVKFVPINDLNADNIVEVLHQSGISVAKKVLIILEGVVFYLKKETVIRILNDLGKMFTKEISVVLDYQTPLLPLKDTSVQSAQQVIDKLEKKVNPNPSSKVDFNFYTDIKSELFDKINFKPVRETTVAALIMKLGYGATPQKPRETCHLLTLERAPKPMME